MNGLDGVIVHPCCSGYVLFWNSLLNSGESESVAECGLETVQCFMEQVGGVVNNPEEFI